MAAEWGCRNVLVRTSQVILATDGGNWALGDRFTELNYFWCYTSRPYRFKVHVDSCCFRNPYNHRRPNEKTAKCDTFLSPLYLPFVINDSFCDICDQFCMLSSSRRLFVTQFPPKFKMMWGREFSSIARENGAKPVRFCRSPRRLDDGTRIRSARFHTTTLSIGAQLYCCGSSFPCFWTIP